MTRSVGLTPSTPSWRARNEELATRSGQLLVRSESWAERNLSSMKERSVSRVPDGFCPAPLRPGGALAGAEKQGLLVGSSPVGGRSRPAGGRP